MVAAAPTRNRAYALGPGDRIGQHVCVEPLAMGGMAELYVARPDNDETLVVIKRALPHLAQDAEFAAMFLKEARLASGLSHPNIAKVLGAHEEDGLFYMVLEYVHGYDLRALIRAAAKDDAALPLGVALRIATELCAGLHHAHEHRDAAGKHLALVHRDVTPSNVLLDLEGRVLLTDFGIARALTTMRTTRAGVIKGKLGYMSPEQCRDAHLDRRSDIFSVGVLLYEMTTGFRMFNAANDFAVMNKIAKGDYTPPGEAVPNYPDALEVIVQRCVAADAQERYPSAAALREDLEAFVASDDLDVSPECCAAFINDTLGGKTLPRLTSVAVSEPPKPARRALGMAAALVLGVVAGGAVVLASTSNDRTAAVPAEPVPPSSPRTHGLAPRPNEAVADPPAPEPEVVAAPVVAAPPPATQPKPPPRKRPKKRVKRPKEAPAGSKILPPSMRGD